MVYTEDGSLMPYHLGAHTKPGPTPGETTGVLSGGDGSAPSPEEASDPDHRKEDWR